MNEVFRPATESIKQEKITMDLPELIDRGQQILNGSFGLLEGYREFEYLRQDIIQYFQDLRDSFAYDLASPENLEEVLKDLRAFLPRDTEF